MEDNNFPIISTWWVLTEGDNGTKARLVARGFEEEFIEKVDSPTVGKCALRMLLTIVSSKQWTAKPTDIKSSFLQGMIFGT